MSETVGMAVLRSQSQAYYGCEIGGHFGLNLTHYAHFTSPIRRYADLIVHRALIKVFNLGEDGTTEREAARLKEIGEHISSTERRAMMAERDAKDRYIAAYMETSIGAEFYARISGVTNFGLFLTLDETGADGLVPIRSLGGERFFFDEKAKKLIGEESGDSHAFGRRVKVRLKEADPVTGGLMFEMMTPGEPGKPPSRAQMRGRGGYNKHSGRRGASGGPRKGSNHDFMPSVYVFPGGRVDRGDSYAPYAGDLSPRTETILEAACSPRQARADLNKCLICLCTAPPRQC